MTASASACCTPLTTTEKAGALREDGKNLILSDGTATLRFFDPATFRQVRHIVVKDHGTQITQLNELEYVHGEIYANVWHTDRIARISPTSGKVLGWIDLTGLLAPGQVTDPEAVLNGIAYDAAHDRLFVTGKLWPKLFEIKIVPEARKTRSRKSREVTNRNCGQPQANATMTIHLNARNRNANNPLPHIAGFNDVTRATAFVSRASCGRAPFRSDFV